MTHYYVFNGDADGLSALQQLRLAQPGDAVLVTGVKRDIALLGRVPAGAGDRCTVLDVSLDTNRRGLLDVLGAGAKVRYFDHHHAGVVPEHPDLETYLDPSPSVCTSLLVDRYLNGQHRSWAIVGAYGDSLTSEAAELATQAGFDSEKAANLEELGICLNYNAYGETIADLHVAPATLAEHMLAYQDPLDFARSSEICRQLYRGYHDDMEQARRLEPLRQGRGAMSFVLPNIAWARRASGVLANELAKSHAGRAVAIVSPKASGGYLVSVRVPAQAAIAADAFCRRFPTGGGRRTAAGINHLEACELDHLLDDFQGTFGIEDVR